MKKKIKDLSKALAAQNGTAKKTKAYKEIMAIIKNNRLQAARIDALINAGYDIGNFPMGSGGVGRIKEMRSHFRLQITCGITKHNYADAIIIPKL